MVRTTLGAEVETEVTVSGSEDVKYVNADSNATIPAGGRETITIRSPTGTVFEMLTVRLRAFGISGQASEDHNLRLRSEAEQIRSLLFISAGDKALEYADSRVASGTISQRPETTTSQTLAVKGLRATDTNGYQVQYRNNTSASQTGRLTVRLWVRQIEVGE